MCRGVPWVGGQLLCEGTTARKRGESLPVWMACMGMQSHGDASVLGEAKPHSFASRTYVRYGVMPPACRRSQRIPRGRSAASNAWHGRGRWHGVTLINALRRPYDGQQLKRQSSFVQIRWPLTGRLTPAPPRWQHHHDVEPVTRRCYTSWSSQAARKGWQLEPRPPRSPSQNSEGADGGGSWAERIQVLAPADRVA